MKKVCYLMIIMALFISVRADEFGLMPMNIHFIGSVASGNNIIAYGDFGAYMMTTDKGKTWKQRSLNDYGTIMEIVNKNDTLWGIIDDGYLLKSLDNGFNWQKQKFTLDKGELFVSILVTDKNIYVHSTEGVRCYDKGFNLINSNKDSLVKIKYYSFNFQEGVKPYTFGNHGLFECYGKIFVSSSKYWNGLLTMPEDLSRVDTVNLSNKIFQKVSHGNTVVLWLEKIYNIKGTYIFNIMNNLYFTDKDLSKFTYFYPDTTFLNANDSNYYKIWKYPEFLNNTYYFKNDDLFMSFFREKNGKRMYGSAGLTMRGGGTCGYYGIKKYNFDGDSSHFNIYNNTFDNKYYTPSIRDNSEGSIADAYSCENTVLNDTIIAKAGLFKTLLQTRDDCKSWELVSSLNGIPKLILNDSTYIFLNVEPNTNDIYRTTDSGQTFIPTEIGLDTAWTFRLHRDSTGRIDTLDRRIDTVTHFGRFEKTAVFYMDSSGRSFWGGPLTFITEYLYNCAFSVDGGKRYKFANVKNLFLGHPSYWESISSNIQIVDSKYIFAVSNPSRKWRDKYWNYIYILNADMKDTLITKADSLSVIHYILADNLEHFYLLTTSQNKDDIYSIRFEIRETIDSGRTYSTINSIDEQLTIEQIYEHNKDSIFFTSSFPARLYLYERKSNKIYTLFNNDEIGSVMVMVLSGKFYLLGNNLFLENTDKTDLTKWKDSEWDYGRPSFESVIFKGNVAIAKLKDDVRELNYYRIKLRNDGNVDVGEKPNSANPNIFISPNPSSDYIELSYPPSEKQGEHHSAMFTGGVSVFDLLGMEHTTPSLRDTPPYQGGEIVRIDVSHLAPGVYFVRVGYVVRKFVKM